MPSPAPTTSSPSGAGCRPQTRPAVPGELAVTGYDDIDAASLVHRRSPPWSTRHAKWTGLRQALLRQLKGDEAEPHGNSSSPTVRPTRVGLTARPETSSHKNGQEQWKRCTTTSPRSA